MDGYFVVEYLSSRGVAGIHYLGSGQDKWSLGFGFRWQDHICLQPTQSPVNQAAIDVVAAALLDLGATPMPDRAWEYTTPTPMAEFLPELARRIEDPTRGLITPPLWTQQSA